MISLRYFWLALDEWIKHLYYFALNLFKGYLPDDITLTTNIEGYEEKVEEICTDFEEYVSLLKVKIKLSDSKIEIVSRIFQKFTSYPPNDLQYGWEKCCNVYIVVKAILHGKKYIFTQAITPIHYNGDISIKKEKVDRETKRMLELFTIQTKSLSRQFPQANHSIINDLQEINKPS